MDTYRAEREIVEMDWLETLKTSKHSE